MTQNVLAAIKRKSRRDGLMAAFTAYKNGEPNSVNRLISLVREFAYTKVYHLEYNFKDTGSAETADDWAQEVAIKVWENLSNFEGSPELFYSWVHKVAFNQASAAFNYLDDAQKSKAGLMVELEGKDRTFFRDNPEIYNQDTPEETPYPHIPEWVDGIDRAIIRLMSVENAVNVEYTANNLVDETTRKYFDNPDEASVWRWRGFNYTEIAAILNLSTAAVKLRIARMRERIQEEKAKEAQLTSSLNHLF
jgi:RNA polymerase sigma factor (sigma-70 family)